MDTAIFDLQPFYPIVDQDGVILAGWPHGETATAEPPQAEATDPPGRPIPRDDREADRDSDDVILVFTAADGRW